MFSREEGSEMPEREDRRREMKSAGFAGLWPSARDAKAFDVHEIDIERVVDR